MLLLRVHRNAWFGVGYVGSSADLGTSGTWDLVCIAWLPKCTLMGYKRSLASIMVLMAARIAKGRLSTQRGVVTISIYHDRVAKAQHCC